MKIFVFAALAALCCTTASADPLSHAVAEFRISLLNMQLHTCHMRPLVDKGAVGVSACVDIKRVEVDAFRKGGFEKLQHHPKVQAMFAQWLKALDSVGTDSEERETAAYEKLAAEVRRL